MKEAEERLDRWCKLKDERANLDNELEEVNEIVAPQRTGYQKQEQYEGRKRTDRRFTSAADTAAQQLAVQLESLNSPKNEQWIKAKPAGWDDGDISTESRAWLDLFERRLWQEIYSPSGGGQQALSECYFDLVVDGTGIIWAEERPGIGTVCRRFGLQNGWIDINADRQVDTLFIREKLTIRQIVGRYKEAKLSHELQRRARHDQDSRERIEIVRYCGPRPVRDPRIQTPEEMPWAHCVYEVATKHKIDEGGFQEQPFAVPRWIMVAGEMYGWSPARAALPDVKSLNQVVKHNLSGGMMRAMPPALIANDGSLQAARLIPRGTLPFDPSMVGSTGMAPAQWMDIRNDGQMGLVLEQNLRRDIGDIFLKHLLSMPTEGPAMTATEVIERKQTFIRMFAPIDGALKSGLNKPFVERIANIMLRRPIGTPGAMPMPPEELDAIGLEFEFESPVQQALDEMKALAARRGLEEIAPMVQMNPGLADNFDQDKLVRDVLLSLGWQGDWFVEREAVEKMRAQKAEQAAQQQSMMAMMEAAKLPGAQPAIQGALGGMPAQGSA